MTEYPFTPRGKSNAMQTADAVRNYCTDLLWDIAPATPGETVKAWLHRAAIATGLKPSIVKRLRYQEVPVVPAHIAFLLQEVAARQVALRKRAEALKAENEKMLVDLRTMRDVDGEFSPKRVGLDAEATEDARQLELKFVGWMRR